MKNSDSIKNLPKRLYFFITMLGLIVITVIGYSLYLGLETNRTHTILANTSLDIKYKTTLANLKLNDYLATKNMQDLQSAWSELDSADHNINRILYDSKWNDGFIFPKIDKVVKTELFGLKNMLWEFKELTNKRSISDPKISPQINPEAEFNFRYKEIVEAANRVKTKLDIVRANDLDDFKVIHYALVGITLLSMISVFGFFTKFDRQRAASIKTIQEANEQLEKEIDEHRQADNALRESEKRLSRLMGNLPGTAYRCKSDDTRTMEFISSGCMPITGYKPEDFINNEKLSFYDIIHPEDKAHVKEQINKALSGKKSFQLVYRIITAPGFEKWVWEKGVGVFSDKGYAKALEGFILDITEQRTAESQLLLLSTALETAANGIMITDAEGNIVWVNAAFAKMTGYNSNDVVGKNARLLKSGKHQQSYYKELWDTINACEVWRGEMINQRKNGSFYDEEMTISPVLDTSGKISHFIGIKTDITARKHADKALRESEERFRGLYENATIGIYQTSPEGKVIMANPTMVKMLGFKSFEDLHFIDIEKGYTNSEQRKKFRDSIRQAGVVTGFESAWRRSDRNIIYLRESARAIKDDEGRMLFIEGTVEDITDRKRAEYALIEAKENAEKSDRLKTEFLAQMSHEIRTPINALLSFANMIREEVEDKVDEDLKEGFKIIDIEGKRVIRTVDLILNMAQLQTDSYVPSVKMIDLYTDVITNAFDEYEQIASDKGLQFLLMKKTDNTLAVADEYSMKQIIANLIDNAIKYTAKGKVEVIVERDDDERLLIQIVDTGIGISKEYLPILFTPFSQEEHGYSRKFDGNGLGLALVKKYCELNNADITVESEKGKGSTFTIIFAS